MQEKGHELHIQHITPRKVTFYACSLDHVISLSQLLLRIEEGLFSLFISHTRGMRYLAHFLHMGQLSLFSDRKYWIYRINSALKL